MEELEFSEEKDDAQMITTNLREEVDQDISIIEESKGDISKEKNIQKETVKVEEKMNIQKLIRMMMEMKENNKGVIETQKNGRK